MIKNLLTRYFLFNILLFGFVVRLISINQSLWMDESISAFAAKNFSYAGIISDFIKSDTHPPFYYLILKFWTEIFGYSELSLRFPSIIFGVLTIFVVYKIASLINTKIAIYASILTAVSPLLIYYSQEVRMYALTTLLVTLCFYFFLKHSWKLFSIILLLLGATDYLPLMIMFPIWLATLVHPEKRSEIKFLFLSHIPLTIFYAIWYPIFQIQQISTLSFLQNNQWWGGLLGVANFKNLALVWTKFLIGRINFEPAIVYFGIILLASLIPLIVLISSLKKHKDTYFYWLWFLIPVVVSFVLSFKLPGFSYFRLIFALPAFIILLSYGFSVAKRGGLYFSIFLISQILFSCIYLLDQNYWREDWKTAVPFIEGKLKDGEYVYVAYPESFTPYTWYVTKPEKVKSLNHYQPEEDAFYTLDYLKDLTDPEGTYDAELDMLGFKNTEVYNFRGVGQVRYWSK